MKWQSAYASVTSIAVVFVFLGGDTNGVKVLSFHVPSKPTRKLVLSGDAQSRKMNAMSKTENLFYRFRCLSSLKAPDKKMLLNMQGQNLDESNTKGNDNVVSRSVSMGIDKLFKKRINNSKHNTLGLAVLVGMITSMIGYIYSKVLSISVDALWKVLPKYLLNKLGEANFNPILFTISIITLGGLLLGLMSLTFSSALSVSDFVTLFSSRPAESLPPIRGNLLPLLLMSLTTSTFGFSVGPEAPMVCAGALVGSSIARFFYKESSNQNQETLAYAGAAGALTAFMGIPLAGSIFVLEMTRPDVGLHESSARALPPAVISSIAALSLVRGVLLPSEAVGGHFDYGSIGKLDGRAMILIATVSGCGGALIGTAFQKFVTLLKHVMWSWRADKRDSSNRSQKIRLRPFLVKAIIGLMVGILSIFYPQTMFWGEGSLQSVIDGQRTAISATKHGLPTSFTRLALINPSIPFSNAWDAAQIGLTKLLAISLACAGKFPGGNIFPLMFAGELKSNFEL